MKIDKDLKDDLLMSPIYQLSLSSRELFHTNFWNWLFSIDAQQSVLLFNPQDSNNTFMAALREKDNIDLTIKTQNYNLYIENKIKSIPGFEQLNKYISNDRSKDVKSKFMLVTLFDVEKIPEGWDKITYSDLGMRLRSFSVKNKYFNSIINDYREMILNLSKLVKSLPNNYVYDFMYSKDNKELFADLEEIKMLDVYIKYRANMLVFYISDKLKHQFTDLPCFYDIIAENITYPYIFCKSGYNDKQGTLDFKLKLNQGICVGVQIQNDQYRLFLERNQCEQYARILLDNSIIFNKSRIFKGGKNVLKYGQVFRYQYDRLTYGTSYDTILNSIVKDLTYMYNNRDRILDLVS